MNQVVQMQQAGLPDSSALPLFITQCLDRVETRCLAGRIDPKEQPDSHGKEEGDKNRCCRDDCLKARSLGNGHRTQTAKDNADEASDHTDDD